MAQAGEETIGNKPKTTGVSLTIDVQASMSGLGDGAEL